MKLFARFQLKMQLDVKISYEGLKRSARVHND